MHVQAWPDGQYKCVVPGTNLRLAENDVPQFGKLTARKALSSLAYT